MEPTNNNPTNEPLDLDQELDNLDLTNTQPSENPSSVGIPDVSDFPVQEPIIKKGLTSTDTSQSPEDSILSNAFQMADSGQEQSNILNSLKTGIQQKFDRPQYAKVVLDRLKQSDNPTLVSVASQLEPYVQEKKLIKPMKNVINKKKLEEMVDKAVQKTLSESNRFTAARKLVIRAKENCLDFEKYLIDELDLLDPNEMDEESQKKFHEITTKLEGCFVNGVIDAIQEFEGLPKATDQVIGKIEHAQKPQQF